jgi:hypothetical protein
MSYALQMDLSKGSIYTDHPPGIFLLWVNLPLLMLAGLQKPVMLFLCDFPLYDQQAEWLCFFTPCSALNCCFSAAGPMARCR